MFSITRRFLLKTLSLAATAASVPRVAWAFVVSAFQTRTVEENPPVFDPATGDLLGASGSRQAYELQVDGLVERPLRLSYADLRNLPQTDQVSDFHCVEGWSVLDVTWGGVRLQQLVDMARPTARATHVVFHSIGKTGYGKGALEHYHECLPVEDLLRPSLEYLLALDRNGSPLTQERGAPLRLVAPFDLAYKSIKFVTRLEFVDAQQDGWWTVANPVYPAYAPVQPARLRRKDPRTA